MPPTRRLIHLAFLPPGSNEKKEVGLVNADTLPLARRDVYVRQMPAANQSANRVRRDGELLGDLRKCEKHDRIGDEYRRVDTSILSGRCVTSVT